MNPLQLARLKLFTKLIAPVLMCVIGFSVVVSLGQHTKHDTFLQLEVAPKGAHITLDGKGVKGGKHTTIPGVHTITFSRSGFATQTEKIALTNGQTIYKGVVLLSNTAKTQNWYNKRPADQKIAEGISSHTSDYKSDTATASNGLLQYLPAIGGGFEYQIDYGVSLDSKHPDETGIYITAATPQARQDAMTWIRTSGYNPANMDIQFNDFINPLQEGRD